MTAINYLWSDPFWRGYLCGAMIVMVMVAPVLFLNAWEVRSLRRQLSRQQSEKP